MRYNKPYEKILLYLINQKVCLKSPLLYAIINLINCGKDIEDTLILLIETLLKAIQHSPGKKIFIDAAVAKEINLVTDENMEIDDRVDFEKAWKESGFDDRYDVIGEKLFYAAIEQVKEIINE
jgi:hypothetical protein